MIHFEKRDCIGILTIDRAKALNAINSEMLDELYEAAQNIAKDEELRCLVITGAGKAFVAGADIAEMRGLTKQEGYEFGLRGHRAFCAIENLEIPVIAAVNGYALGGGCELALCADIRIASEKAKFGQPEVGLGITPGFGGTQRLIRTVNRAHAIGMILTGKVINAEKALEIGLVTKVVPAEQLMDETLAIASAIAANAPIAVRNAKKAMRLRYLDRLPEDLEEESRLFGECFETEDQRMAMNAFVEKTEKAPFKGK